MGKNTKKEVEVVQLYIVVLNLQERGRELLLPPALRPEAGVRLLGRGHGPGLHP